MKKSSQNSLLKSSLLIVLLTFTFSLSAQNETLKQAEKQYTEGNYIESVELYKSVEDSGYVSASLYFNMGNAYFKSGKLPEAILYFERALLLDPNNENIQYNREMAQQYVVDKIDVITPFVLNTFLNNIRKTLTVDNWGMLAIITMVLFVIGLFLYFFSSNSTLKRVGFYVGMLFLLVSVFSTWSGNAEKERLISKRGAIIFSPTVTLKSSPDNSGTDLFILHEGTKVGIRDKVAGWYEIKLSDGNVGWIKEESLQKI